MTYFAIFCKYLKHFSTKYIEIFLFSTENSMKKNALTCQRLLETARNIKRDLTQDHKGRRGQTYSFLAFSVFCVKMIFRF